MRGTNRRQPLSTPSRYLLNIIELKRQMAMIDRDFTKIEKHWRAVLPATFRQLYSAYDEPLVGVCEFFSLSTILNDQERWRGMLPQFHPFAEDGDENFYGFYLGKNGDSESIPVLFWNHEYDHYYPVGSDFDGFLRYAVHEGRFLMQDRFEEDEIEEEEYHMRQVAGVTGIPDTIVLEIPPRNERELYEKIVHSDPQNAFALCQLGSWFYSSGDVQRATDCFVRASEAAPWYADPIYLLGEAYKSTGDLERAVGLWWQVVQMPIALSSRTAIFAIRTDIVDCEVYEACTNLLIENVAENEVVPKNALLWQLLKKGDPFSPIPRLELATKFAENGDNASAGRELLNALTLATEDEDIATSYHQLKSYYTDSGKERDAAFCSIDSELE